MANLNLQLLHYFFEGLARRLMRHAIYHSTFFTRR